MNMKKNMRRRSIGDADLNIERKRIIQKIQETIKGNIKAKVDRYDSGANTIEMFLTKTEYEGMLNMYGVAPSVEAPSVLKGKPIFLIFPNPNYINGKIFCLIDTILKGSEEVKLTIKVWNTNKIYKDRLQRAISSQKTYQNKEGVAGYALLQVRPTAIPATAATLEVVKKISGEVPYEQIADEPIQSTGDIAEVLTKVNAALSETDYTTNVIPGSPTIRVANVIMDNVQLTLSEMKNDMIRVEVQKPWVIRSLVKNGTDWVQEGINTIGGRVKKALGVKIPARAVRTQNEQRNIVISPTGIKDVSLIEAFEEIAALSNEKFEPRSTTRTIVGNKEEPFVNITNKRTGEEIRGRVTYLDYDPRRESITLQFVPNDTKVLLELSNTDKISIANMEFQMYSYMDIGM